METCRKFTDSGANFSIGEPFVERDRWNAREEESTGNDMDGAFGIFSFSAGPEMHDLSLA